MTTKIENGMLVISIEIASQPKPSASGKTLVVASTHGAMPTDCEVAGKRVVINLNAYIKREGGQYE